MKEESIRSLLTKVLMDFDQYSFLMPFFFIALFIPPHPLTIGLYIQAVRGRPPLGRSFALLISGYLLKAS